MMMHLLTLLFTLISSAFAAVAVPPCSINLDSRKGTFLPLITQKNQFLYPNGSRVIDIANNGVIKFLCHGSPLAPSLINLVSKETSLQVTCKSEKFVDANGNVVDVHSLSCSKINEPEIRVTRNSSCAAEGADGRNNELDRLALVQIGWNVTDTVFLEQIRLCVDELLYATLWSTHVVVGQAINQRDMTEGRPAFRRDLSGFKRLFPEFPSQTALDNSYSKASEAKQMTKLLGSNLLFLNSTTSESIIDTSTSGTAYFARGHLAPDAAFFYDVCQDATYFFVNAAPQFQTFNNGNWKATEGAIRDYAASKKQNVDVWTGTYGFLRYKSQPIFLYTEAGKKWLPAPEYYWTVVHNKVENKAIAFIGLNDAHSASPPPLLCQSQCHLLSWADWAMSDLGSGFMYCCDVQELRKTIHYLPNLVKKGVWPQLLADVPAAGA